MLPDAQTMALYLRKPAIDKLEVQAKEIEKIGDLATTVQVILFNPSKRKPYGVFTEIKDQDGKRATKLRENLSLSQMVEAAQKSFERALKELSAPPIRCKNPSTIEVFRNRLRIQGISNAQICKTNMPQHPQRPQ